MLQKDAWHIIQRAYRAYREHKTNEYVWQQVSILAGPQELLQSTVKRRKLSWFDHVCRYDTLPKIILQGSVDGKHRRGRPRKSWKDNIKEWPVDVINAPRCRGQASMGGRHGGCICRGIPTTPGRQGF